MLTIYDESTKIGRRDFLQVGSLALGGMTLPGLLATDALAQGDKSLLKGKSVIFVFQHGGPSQTETFDPKMTAPEGIRSVTGEIKTRIPGVTFGTTMQNLAQLNDKFTIVRSFKAGSSAHDIKPIKCRETLNANMGSLYSRIAGSNHPLTGMPTSAVLYPRAVNPKSQKGVTQFGNFASPGQLGAASAPFVPSGDGTLKKNMKLSLSRQRLDDRRSLLLQLDRIKRQIDNDGLLNGADRYQEQAFETILGGVANAFDLTQESAATIAKYDTAPLVPDSSVYQKWNNRKNYRDHSQTLGKLLLLARRLCEGGCGFVTVTTGFVWDMHSDVNNAPPIEGMQYVGRPFDHAVAALIRDIEARGLSDKIMVVCTGEMGRTPRVNKKAGRDHWGRITPLMIAGGGLEMGQVIGRSNKDAGEPASEPMTNRHLLATIMNNMIDMGELRVTRGVPRDLEQALTSAKPIPGLL